MNIGVAVYLRPVGAPAIPPSPAPGHVQRPSVDALLDRAAKYRISLVIGAAGWGKTTAVASWSAGRPTAWVPYEDHEGDAHLLLGRLVTVLQDYAVVPAREVAPTARTGDAPAAAAVCSWIARGLRKDVMLVLDDVHGLYSHSDAMHVLANLCRHVPDQLHLVLISRCELPISLQRLRGRGLVKGIHAPDLAFDIADVEALLRQTVGPDRPAARRRGAAVPPGAAIPSIPHRRGHRCRARVGPTAVAGTLDLRRIPSAHGARSRRDEHRTCRVEPAGARAAQFGEHCGVVSGTSRCATTSSKRWHRLRVNAQRCAALRPATTCAS